MVIDQDKLTLPDVDKTAARPDGATAGIVRAVELLSTPFEDWIWIEYEPGVTPLGNAKLNDVPLELAIFDTVHGPPTPPLIVAMLPVVVKFVPETETVGDE